MRVDALKADKLYRLFPTLAQSCHLRATITYRLQQQLFFSSNNFSLTTLKYGHPTVEKGTDNSN